MRALVTGITGQDGYYMAAKLLSAGVAVVALVRDVAKANAVCRDLGAKVEYLPFDFGARGAVEDVIDRVGPRYIFNFAAKSTGEGMFDSPLEMERLNAGFPMDILHAMLASERKKDIRFVQASSSEMFGLNDAMPQNEAGPFLPTSPYGAAKLYVHNMISIYRHVHGIHASSAILFNHESPRRGGAFVTRKIVTSAVKIGFGMQEKLTLGSISSRRDWGYAPEYVDAMYRMAQHDVADDYVIATGKLHDLTDVLTFAFNEMGLSYEQYVEVDAESARKTDSKCHCGDASKIRAVLGWNAKTSLGQIISEMVSVERDRILAVRENNDVI